MRKKTVSLLISCTSIGKRRIGKDERLGNLKPGFRPLPRQGLFTDVSFSRLSISIKPVIQGEVFGRSLYLLVDPKANLIRPFLQLVVNPVDWWNETDTHSEQIYILCKEFWFLENLRRISFEIVHIIQMRLATFSHARPSKAPLESTTLDTFWVWW